MSMIKSLTRATNANEEGSAFLEVGETIRALKSFRAALKQLNEGCQDLPGNLPSNASLMNNSDSSISLGTAVSSRPVRLGEDSEAVALPVSPDNNPAVLYSQSFVFEDPTTNGTMTIERHSFVSAVLIYNTALALHQKGSKEDGHKASLKALLFYRESLNLLRPVADEPESVRVIQEIMKNQADIYYKLNNNGNLQRVWEEMAQLAKDRSLSRLEKKIQGAVSA